MADYNIYIHSALTGSSTSPTIPWSSGDSTSIKPWSDSGESFSSKIAKDVSKASGVMMNPDGLISQGIGFLAKAIPWVAIAMIVLTVADKIVSTKTSYEDMETGDYRSSTTYNNNKAAFRAMLTPFSTYWNEVQAQNRFRITNYKQTQQRALLGDSVINAYTDRGV